MACWTSEPRNASQTIIQRSPKSRPVTLAGSEEEAWQTPPPPDDMNVNLIGPYTLDNKTKRGI